MRLILTFILIAVFASPVWAAPENSGLPIPRFVSLKSDEVNVRTGPGTRYPIQWIYHRVSLPVEVVEEYDLWRKIRDGEGTTGWVHKNMLDGKRTVSIQGKDAQVLRIDPDDAAKAMLKAEPSVIGKLLECQPQWCRIQVSGRKGWVQKKYLWGVYSDEVFD